MGILSNIKNRLTTTSPSVNTSTKTSAPAASGSSKPSSNIVSDGINRSINLVSDKYNNLSWGVKAIGVSYLSSLVISNTVGMNNFARLSIGISGFTLRTLKNWVIVPVARSFVVSTVEILKAFSEMVVEIGPEAIDSLNKEMGPMISNGVNSVIPAITPSLLNIYLVFQAYQAARVIFLKIPDWQARIFNNETVQNLFNLGFSSFSLYASYMTNNSMIVPMSYFLYSFAATFNIFEKVKVNPEIFLSLEDRERLETFRVCKNERGINALINKGKRIFANQDNIHKMQARRDSLVLRCQGLADDNPDKQRLNGEIAYIDDIINKLRNPPLEIMRKRAPAADSSVSPIRANARSARRVVRV